MKIKAIISLLLSFTLLIGLSACKKSEINIGGDDTYTYNGEFDNSSSEAGEESKAPEIFEYNDTELSLRDKLDWKSNDEGKSHIFYIKNLSGVKITQLAYKPKDYDVFKSLKIIEFEGNVNYIKISEANMESFNNFDFLIVTEDGITTVFEEINPQKRGIEISFTHSSYSFEYIK